MHEHVAVVIPEAEGELAAFRLLTFIAAVCRQQAAHKLGVLAHAHIEGCDDFQDGVIADRGAGLLCVLHLLRLTHLQGGIRGQRGHDTNFVYHVVVLGG